MFQNNNKVFVEDKVATIILAGGQGTRLFPLTQTRCKPDVSFGGRYRLIDVPISNSINSEIHQIYVISQFFASHLNKHIKETFDSKPMHGYQIELLNPEEVPKSRLWYKGTADAVRKNMPHFEQTDCEYFVILSGDQLYSMDLQEMLAQAKKKDADLMIAALPVNKKDAKRMGLLRLKNNGNIEEFVEKPREEAILKRFKSQSHTKQDQYLASMGIYIFKRDALFEALQGPGMDFGKEIIPSMITTKKCFAYEYDGYWEDIGTVESFYAANLALTKNELALDLYSEHKPIYAQSVNLPCPLIRETVVKDSIISDGSIILAQSISGSMIGIRSHILEGTVIRDSIIMGNHYYSFENQQKEVSEGFSIGRNCIIEKAIIDEEVQIGHNVTLVNHRNLKKYDSDGIYIRDGIIVITSGTKIPDGFTLF